jgi:hypothetical protein
MADDARSWRVERTALFIAFLVLFVLSLAPSGAAWVQMLLGLDFIGIGAVTLVDRDGTMRLYQQSYELFGVTMDDPGAMWGIAVVSAIAIIIVGLLMIAGIIRLPLP